jgi:hypothetical protein
MLVETIAEEAAAAAAAAAARVSRICVFCTTQLLRDGGIESLTIFERDTSKIGASWVGCASVTEVLSEAGVIAGFDNPELCSAGGGDGASGIEVDTTGGREGAERRADGIGIKI